MAPAVMTATESPAPEIDAYRPAGVFISYASEDYDIAQTIACVEKLAEASQKKTLAHLGYRSGWLDRVFAPYGSRHRSGARGP